jgi:hypothetical protein
MPTREGTQAEGRGAALKRGMEISGARGYRGYAGKNKHEWQKERSSHGRMAVGGRDMEKYTPHLEHDFS